MILCPLPGLPRELGGSEFYLSQDYGMRPREYREFGLKGHNGYDFAPVLRNRPGMMLYAPLDGVVQVFNDGKVGYGQFVRIIGNPDPQGKCLEITLAHMDRIDVPNGLYVKALSPLGLMGSTGHSTAIHVHITPRYRRNNIILDYDNGYHGAQPLKQFIRYWHKEFLR